MIAFIRSFKGKRPATIRLPEGRPGDTRYVDVENPIDNIKASDIVDAAIRDKWKVCNKPLGHAAFIGSQLPALCIPIRFAGIPLHLKSQFITNIPRLIETALASPDKPLHCKARDVWEIETLPILPDDLFSETDTDQHWTFSNDIVVLFELTLARFITPLDVASEWRGWYMLNNTFLLTLTYPGRFSFCPLCRHKCQDLAGEFKRHILIDCLKYICNYCGNRGHFEDKCKKKAADEAKIHADQHGETDIQPSDHQAEHNNANVANIQPSSNWGPLVQRQRALNASAPSAPSHPPPISANEQDGSDPSPVDDANANGRETAPASSSTDDSERPSPSDDDTIIESDGSSTPKATNSSLPQSENESESDIQSSPSEATKNSSGPLGITRNSRLPLGPTPTPIAAGTRSSRQSSDTQRHNVGPDRAMAQEDPLRSGLGSFARKVQKKKLPHSQ
ncbi:uncharacterized protein SPSC_01201 [Sporisorium scitamineum]|uniref:Uncharacterized protein n=1 Tax=Sporisorium scitamineum TaxID=49012 RepID=A0A127Z8U4_9BASI|nr:uncharacterized protein SPSC_01201 [Sporisorium scitamineum]